MGDAYLKTLVDDLHSHPCFTDLDDCFAQGEASADQGRPRASNPYQIGTKRREWWDAGWSQSYNELCGR